MLLAGASLFVTSLRRVVARNVGFDRDNVLVVAADARAAGYRDGRQIAFYDELQQRLARLPGVVSASLSWYPPISDQDGHWTQSVGVDGAAPSADPKQTVHFNAVSPAYFSTMGIRLLAGRDFTLQDHAGAPRVAIVNESIARRFFAGGNALGRRISIGLDRSRQNLEIVGIVSDAAYQRLEETPRRIAYLPCAQLTALLGDATLTAEVRVTPPLAAVAGRVAREVAAIDRRVPLRVETVTDRIDDSLVKERIVARLAIVLGLAALALAGAATYGLLACAVSRQRKELGVRVALGAGRATLLWMILRQSLALAMVGSAAGLRARARPRPVRSRPAVPDRANRPHRARHRRARGIDRPDCRRARAGVPRRPRRSARRAQRGVGDVVSSPMRFFIVAVVVLCGSVASGQDAPPLRGFIGASADAERQVETRFRAVPSPDNLREYMRTIVAEPHHAGSPGSRKVADYVLGKFKAWGLNAQIEEFEALMPFPTERVLELVGPDRFVATLQEPPVEEDPDSADAGQLPSFNAYSADGDVTADLVYVNYGMPEDYEQLTKLGVDVKGKIVIARYGRSWRGIKPKVASEHGAVGCIIYSDPRDDGYFAGDVFPSGAFRPEQGVQRGSVMDMPVYPGDPLTPGWASERGGKKLDARRSQDPADDPGAADLLRRCAAAAAQLERTGGPGELARRAAAHLPCRAQARRRCTSSWRSSGSIDRSTTSSRASTARSLRTNGSSTAIITTPGSTARPIRPAGTSR